MSIASLESKRKEAIKLIQEMRETLNEIAEGSDDLFGKNPMGMGDSQILKVSELVVKIHQSE